MLQQSKGYELVYDAASGKYPEDVGYTHTSGNIPVTLEDNALVMEASGSLRNRYDLLTATAESKSFEVWLTPISGTTSIRLQNNTTRVSFFITTTTDGGYYIKWGVGVYVDWSKPFVKKPYNQGDMLKLRLVNDKEYTAAYMNDELIYETHTAYPQNVNVANIDISQGKIKVHKMIYKEL